MAPNSLPTNAWNPAEPAWYCVRSQQKQEHIAAAHLRKLEQVQVFCPRIKYEKATRRGRAWFTEALFTGYLFAKFPLHPLLSTVAHTFGVQNVVRFGPEYARIPEAIVRDLKEECGDVELRVFEAELSPGSEVNFTGGSFSGLRGVVNCLIPAKDRVRVLIEFLGRTTEAEVPADLVLQPFQHPLAV